MPWQEDALFKIIVLPCSKLGFYIFCFRLFLAGKEGYTKTGQLQTISHAISATGSVQSLIRGSQPMPIQLQDQSLSSFASSFSSTYVSRSFFPPLTLSGMKQNMTPSVRAWCSPTLIHVQWRACRALGLSGVSFQGIILSFHAK